MRLIRGGTFPMGANDFYPEEAPVRNATVGDFWMDETPVTNAQFAAFVMATGYVTFAERFLSSLDFPAYTPDMLVPGSSVFLPPDNGPTIRFSDGVLPDWWLFVPGANWRSPLGPGSDIAGLDQHPVVHVLAADAEAYAAWGGKALPTEAEWEYAARGGYYDTPYAWGEELEPKGRRLAKYWEGDFPGRNLAAPGLERTAPVRSYPPNGYGLYDMIANVWEWTSDWYADARDRLSSCCGGTMTQPERMHQSIDPYAAAAVPRRVIKGGSHLCAVNYCRRYRPAARIPQAIDTSTSHIGFRCIVRR